MKLTKTFKTVLTLALLLAAGVLLVGCKKPIEPPVELPEEDIPLTPLEPATPKEEELNKSVKPEGDLNYVDFGDNFERGVFQTITVDTKDFKEIIITIKGENEYQGAIANIPVNIRGFKVNNVDVEQEGIKGTSYVENQAFTIGDLPAIAHLVNTHKFEDITDIRLHTWHKDKGTEHFIKVDVTNVDTFEFQFAVTTGAVAALEGIRVTYNK